MRKFNVGTFSALIATVTFISTNPTTASAARAKSACTKSTSTTS
ncbi:YSIRK-type signal peptide-containing protein [Staphylococcus aureus]